MQLVLLVPNLSGAQPRRVTGLQCSAQFVIDGRLDRRTDRRTWQLALLFCVQLKFINEGEGRRGLLQKLGILVVLVGSQTSTSQREDDAIDLEQLCDMKRS